MNKIKNFNSFLNENLKTDKMVVKNVEYDDYDNIIKIELTDGRTITPGEDTGGEDVSLEIKNGHITKGDVIEFEYDNSQFDKNYIQKYGEINELWEVSSITINGVVYKCNVGSDGGNTSTYLTIE